MNEKLLLRVHEKIENRLAYSGTTIEMFLTCASSIDQHVHFNKSKEPRCTTGAFWTTIGLEGAAHWAISRAGELKHTPLIMECDMGSQDIGPVPQNQEIPVTRIWLPRKEMHIDHLIEIMWENFSDQEIPHPESYFEEYDSLRILNVDREEAMKAFKKLGTGRLTLT